MRPILFTVGSIAVPSYYFFLLLGLIIGLAVAAGAAKNKQDPLSSAQIGSIALIVVPFSYLMGMVNGWLFNPYFFLALGDGRLVLSGGLVSFGAILGSFWIGGFSAKRLGLSSVVILDLITLAWPLILGFLRIGCLLNGCCHGLETESVFGMMLPGDYDVWAPRYPTQLILIVFNFGLFALLWLRSKRIAFDGELTMLFLIGYSAGRLLIDALRELPTVLGPFSLHQLTAILILFLSGIIYFKALAGRRSSNI